MTAALLPPLAHPRLARALPALVIVLTLAVLAGIIGWAQLRLREQVRAQVANRDGETLHALSLLEQRADESDVPMNEPADQLDLIITISRLHGVLGVRLFRPDGTFVNAVPGNITEGEVPPADLPRLAALQPVSHFEPAGHLDEIDLLSSADGETVPLLLVYIPLHAPDEKRLRGIAEYVLRGDSIAGEFRLLDRQLLTHGAIGFLATGALVGVGLALAFRRVQRANLLVSERTASLLQANRELAMAAKTSAVGALTAHLVHGLKSPLVGLQSFVESRRESRPDGEQPDWAAASATTETMQRLINRVVQILEDQETCGAGDVALAEVADLLAERGRPLAAAAGTSMHVRVLSAGRLPHRTADLVLVILENLVQNAAQASAPGQTILVRITGAPEQAVFEVEDSGPGLAEAVRARLFAPCRSTKRGGSGLGLAISKQLAAHLGGTLELTRSTPAGCVFRLTVPRLEPPADADAATSPAELSRMTPRF